MDKKGLMKQLQKDWEKYWKIDFLVGAGFNRHQCNECKKYFWSLKTEKKCNDCKEPEFLERKLMNKKYDYFQAWKAIKDFFVKNGHHALERYPTVCRWFPLYFTIAAIVNFYRMDGDGFVFEFPKTPVILLQPSMRFLDIENVGKTGAHWTCHGHIEQAGTSYWKEEAIKLDYELLTKVFGIDPKEIHFIEDAWMGAGAFGYSLEYFVPGLELGNCVFTEFSGTPENFKRLEKPVIDMGAGIERFCWISQQTPTSYEAVMNLVIDKIKSKSGKKGMEHVYALADHARTLCFAITDGAVPSNVGGGHNLRVIIRRAFNFIEKYDMSVDMKWICKEVAEFFKPLNPELVENLDRVNNIIDIEYARYTETKSRMEMILKKAGKLTEDKIIELYDSHGITPEMLNVEPPKDFYEKVTARHEKAEKEEKVVLDFPKTDKKMVYEDVYEFEAGVLDVNGEKVILDKTAFYPTGGGQESDKGKLNDCKVYAVELFGDVVVHSVEGVNFRKGDVIKGKIDKDRREQILKHHTATHVINLSCQKVLGPHIWQEGSKKDEDKAHLDISHYDTITGEQLKQIEKYANDIINQGIEVRREVLPRMEAEQKYGFRIYQGAPVPLKTLTIISIDDLEHEACGGIHLHNTKDIEEVHVFKASRIQDGFYRIEFVAGKELIKKTKEKITELRKKEKEDLDKKKKRIEEKKKQLKSIDVKPMQGINYIDTDDMKVIEVHGKKSVPKDSDKFVVLIGNGIVYGRKGDKCEKDIESIVKKVAKEFGGHAGGKGNEFRGGGPNKDKAKQVVEGLK